MTDRTPRRGAWARALEMAGRTPPSRNRYVDFLRALSICAVISGHWIIAAPWIPAGEPIRLDHMLELQPWTRWLTWLFQVMPIFFMVGGFSNAASWESARRDGRGFGPWLSDRLRRLIGPIVPLVVFWALFGATAHLAGVHPQMITIGSQAALVPIWFLAVYCLAVAFVPWTRAAWRRYGVASFWALAAAAVAVDAIAFAGGFGPIRWVNYLFVWLAVHQLGYLWRDERAHGVRALPWAALGGATLYALVGHADYPLSMVGVPGEEVSNTLPPTLAMLALGCLQAGLLLALQAPARRLLARPATWAATILINASIMSVYLWHMTALVCVVGLLNLGGGLGLGLTPGTSTWWATRPAWMLLLAVALIPFVAVFGRFERPSTTAPAGFPAWRGVVGALLACAGLALLALGGVGGGWALGLRLELVALPLVGAWLGGALPGR